MQSDVASRAGDCLGLSGGSHTHLHSVPEPNFAPKLDKISTDLVCMDKKQGSHDKMVIFFEETEVMWFWFCVFLRGTRKHPDRT